MKRIYSSFLPLVVLTGCAADSAMVIHGVAPTKSDCEVRMVKSNTNEIVLAQKVNGDFRETLIWGAWSGNLDLVAVCDGVATKTVKEWRMPRNYSEGFELGDISP